MTFSSDAAGELPRPVRVRSSEEWEEPSPVDGYPYRVLLAHPDGEAPPGGFPALYVLDADAIFATVVEAVRMRSRRPDVTRVEPAVVIGIAHSIENPFDRQRRRFDYTPGPQAGTGRESDAEVGGSGQFLDFLEQTVIPAARRRSKLDKARQGVFGHSLAGLLTLHALARPGLFRTHGAASPSIWWNPPELADLVGRLRSRSADGAGRPRAMITVGEYEEKLAAWELSSEAASEIRRRRATRRMVSGAREVADALVDAGIPTAFEAFSGENHASALLLSINRFLPFALSAPPRAEDQPRRDAPPSI